MILGLVQQILHRKFSSSKIYNQIAYMITTITHILLTNCTLYKNYGYFIIYLYVCNIATISNKETMQHIIKHSTAKWHNYKTVSNHGFVKYLINSDIMQLQMHEDIILRYLLQLQISKLPLKFSDTFSLNCTNTGIEFLHSISSVR